MKAYKKVQDGGLGIEKNNPFLCHNCGGEYLKKEGAEVCCSYSCPKCESFFDNEEDSLDCCKSKKYGTIYGEDEE